MAALSISERIAASSGQKPEYKLVDVVLDGAIAAQVSEIEDRIAGLETEISEHEQEKARIAPERKFSDPRPKALDEKITAIQEQIAAAEAEADALREGTVVTLRFDRLPGNQWAEIAARHPARLDVVVDRISGYNYQATAREAAPLCGYVVGKDDAGEDTREDLTPEDWVKLWPILSGRETEQIQNSLWELNDWNPRKKIERAKKG